jgi:hypothetical protein
MKIARIGTALALGLLVASTARAELRHVEMKTLGMD